MEIKKVIKDGDRYFCNEMDVSVEEWKNILQDNSLMYDTYKDTLIKFYKEPEHKSTCKALGEKYNAPPESYSGIITNFAKAAQKKLNRFEVVGTDGKPSYWIIPMLGKSIGKYFEWTLRPELVQAMEEIGMTENSFFTREDLRLFEKFAGKSKHDFPEAHSLLRIVYNKLGKITDALNQTGKYKCEIRRNPLNQGGVYEQYHWARIYPVDLYEDCTPKIFFVVGIQADGMNIHIDSYTSKGYSPNETAEKIKTETWEQIDVETIITWTFVTIISKIEKYIEEYLTDFLYFGKEFGIQKCIDRLEQIKMETYIQEIIKLLKNNKNLILTGAPGTGKTYLAKQIAEAMGAIKENKNMEFVQFHPSYDYTDFVEGLRPAKPDEKGNIGFKRIDGVFKNFCKKAKDNPDKDHVFIIDEINRGEISKIFGELFFSIDPSYRGTDGKVQTQYANLIEDGDIFKEGFYVPENVFIIGTMNDIDRSVESFDFAMRRRFTWKEITAEESQRMFENETWKDEAIKRMNALNSAISNIQGLGAAYHIGAAYFKNNLPKYADNPFENLWNYHLKSLLFEYLRGMPDAETKLKELENAYNPKFYTTF